MANILDLRRRIRSVKNTKQITKAMQMVSAAKLRRAQERALAARPYAQMLTNVLKSLVSRADLYDPSTGEPIHPLLFQREEKSILLVIVTGEKGLAGAFNSNLIKSAVQFMATKQGKNIDIVTIGRKGRDYFHRRYPFVEDAAAHIGEQAERPRKGEIQIIDERVGVIGKNSFAAAREVAELAVNAYRCEEVDSVYLVFNEFKSVIAQRLVVEHVLPITQIGERDIAQAIEMSQEERQRAVEAAAHAGHDPHATTAAENVGADFATKQIDYLYEQPAGLLLRDLLPKYVSVQFYRALLESEAAEHAARMTAMDSATNNATDVIDTLTLAMNRARQAKITTEIIEIVSGAAAL